MMLVTKVLLAMTVAVGATGLSTGMPLPPHAQCLVGEAGSSPEQRCDSLMHSVKVIKRGKKMTALQVAKVDPMSPDCEEPGEIDTSSRLKAGADSYTMDSAGPEKVVCCKTAQEKVKYLEEKTAHCGSGPAVPCWKSLQTVLPNYLEYNKEQEAELCSGAAAKETKKTEAGSDGSSGSGEGSGSGDWCKPLCEEGMSAEA